MIKQIFTIRTNLHKISDAIGSVDTTQERKIINAVIKAEEALDILKMDMQKNWKRIKK